jgi:hypothetical protein
MRYVVCRGERIKAAYLSAWQVSSETATDNGQVVLVFTRKVATP